MVVLLLFNIDIKSQKISFGLCKLHKMLEEFKNLEFSIASLSFKLKTILNKLEIESQFRVLIVLKKYEHLQTSWILKTLRNGVDKSLKNFTFYSRIPKSMKKYRSSDEH